MNPPPKFAPYRRKRWPWILGALAALVAAVAGYLYINAQSLLDAFREGDKARIVSSAEGALGKNPRNKLAGLRPGTTFLLVGSDTRPYEGKQWGRSDTMLVAKIFPKDKAISILSIPRDTLVDIPGQGMDKINAAYTVGGPGLLIATVRDFLGVRIDHYFQMDFAGFGRLIEEFRGVYLPIDQRYKHFNDGYGEDYMEIDIKPGYQRLRAYDALSWVRFRHLDDDFYRASRQQIFLREVSRQLSERAGGDLGQIRGLAQAIAEAGASDFSSVGEAARLANTLREIPPSRVVRLTLNGSSVWYNGGADIEISEAEKARVLRIWNNPSLALSRQKKRQGEATETGNTLLSVLQSIGRPVAKLRPWGNWMGAGAVVRGAEEDARAFLLKSQTRQLLTGNELGKKNKKQRKRLAPNPSKVLVFSPLPSKNKARGLSACRPQRLPPGYYWPQASGHKYTLGGSVALARYATASSGNSILWMWSNWDSAPILQNPDDGVMIKNRVYDIWWESGSVRQVAWRDGATHVWITNTLKNNLSANQMIALARSCS